MPLFEPMVGEQPDVESVLPKCGSCGLKDGCLSPLMPVAGEGQRKVLIVGEAPGEEEDKRGKPFVGPAGRTLRDVLGELDVDLDRDCWTTNSLICRPPNNAKPTNDRIGFCRPNLTRTIKELQPCVIIPLGDSAIRSIVGPLWRQDTRTVGMWVGWQIPHVGTNVWICPTYHPSYVLRSQEAKNYEVIRLWFKLHLQRALSFQEQPYQTPPDYLSRVKVIYDSNQAAEHVRRLLAHGRAISFDYETNRLKPDTVGAQIVCCAVSDGKQSIAFLWVGEVMEAMRELFVSDVPKIGYNCKFETRWTRKILGCDVNNWVWDGMLSSHHLDCRPNITSVKFQAFVRLGVDPWSERVAPYLKAADERGFNRIKEVNKRELLMYCGLDALYELLVAKKQRKEMMYGST